MTVSSASSEPLPAPPPAVRWRSIAELVTLLVLTCVCYWPSLQGGFLWDDDLWLSNNPLIQSVNGLWRMWFSTQSADYYPLTSTSFWLEWRLWGADPLGYRVTNLALHLLDAGLVWRLLRVLRVPGAWFAALLFAVHPVNVASVAWIAERKNTLSMAFALACVIHYVHAEESQSSRSRRGWYATSLAWFILALLSKSAAVAVPPVLLVLIWWRRNRVQWADLRRTAPFFLAALLSGLACIWFQHRAMHVWAVAAEDSLSTRLLIAPRTLLFYVAKFFVPIDLSMIYPRWVVRADSPLAYLPLAGVTALCILVWKKKAKWGRWPVAALGCFALPALPISGLVPTGFSAFSYVSDHLIYFSMVSLAATTAALFATWQAKRGQAYPAGASQALLALLLVSACWGRAAEFGAPERLWRHTLTMNPDSAVGHNNLGYELLHQRKWSVAEFHFRRALALQPSLFAAASNLANALDKQNHWQEAAETYRVALAKHPDAKDYTNYGVICLQMNRPDDARAQFRRASALAPRLLSPHFNLYKMAAQEGNYLEAADELSACLQLDPNDVPSLNCLATLSVRAAPPDAVPPIAIALAKRANRLSRATDPVSREILTWSAQSTSAPETPARLPEVARAIERCAHALPNMEQGPAS